MALALGFPTAGARLGPGFNFYITGFTPSLAGAYWEVVPTTGGGAPFWADTMCDKFFPSLGSNQDGQTLGWGNRFSPEFLGPNLGGLADNAAWNMTVNHWHSGVLIDTATFGFLWDAVSGVDGLFQMLQLRVLSGVNSSFLAAVTKQLPSLP